MTEAALLLTRYDGTRNAGVKLELLARKALRIDFSLADDSVRIAEFISQYRDVPMSLADACLVRMSERHPQSQVLTLDSDFHVYRRFHREAIPLISMETP